MGEDEDEDKERQRKALLTLTRGIWRAQQQQGEQEEEEQQEEKKERLLLAPVVPDDVEKDLSTAVDEYLQKRAKGEVNRELPSKCQVGGFGSSRNLQETSPGVNTRGTLSAAACIVLQLHDLFHEFASVCRTLKQQKHECVLDVEHLLWAPLREITVLHEKGCPREGSEKVGLVCHGGGVYHDWPRFDFRAGPGEARRHMTDKTVLIPVSPGPSWIRWVSAAFPLGLRHGGEAPQQTLQLPRGKRLGCPRDLLGRR